MQKYKATLLQKVDEFIPDGMYHVFLSREVYAEIHKLRAALILAESVMYEHYVHGRNVNFVAALEEARKAL